MSELHRFVFAALPVRGILVRLTTGWQEVLARRAGAGAPWPEPVRILIGEMTAAGVLMHANIKFDGSLVLQVYGDGPVKLAVAEIGPELSFRATAQVNGEVAADAGLAAMLNAHGGGRCAITLQPATTHAGQQPYQGIVPLHDERDAPLQAVASVLEHYMRQSEQLDTRLVLASDDKVAAGLLLQRSPSIDGADDERIGRDEDFNRIAHLASTLGRAELLGLDAETILRRLFWAEKLTRFAPLVGAAAPRFACSCSRTRVGNMLRGLGDTEVDDIVRERGSVEVGCEFCGLQYRFDPVDARELFVAARDQAPGSSTIN